MGAGIGWTVALGATTTAAVALAIAARPRDPTFSLLSISLSSLHLRFPIPPIPILDLELTLSISVTNPNLAPISYSPSAMCIYYDDALLGQAKVEAGSQPARSVRTLRLSARLDGLELTHHLARLIWDVIRREMELKAVVKIEGKAKLLVWDHPFVIYVESNVLVDPLFLDVLDQETRSRLELSLSTNT
ncbi:uncharacterized protein LOC18441261, partial [Amborella trichopoda]|uniref:uncharacterized protein LOC18441261 n=1 Tax=Amborella trichopoda TaxID=13333 RepID=UPI0005D388C8